MQFTQEELNLKLELHVEWLNSIEGGIRLDLHSADLRSANLRSADLHSADLRYANLSSADLSSADLSSADLHSANLHSADLHSANLHSADLHSADLSSADLSSANIDFTAWFSCGFLGIKCDMLLIAQYAYHLCRLEAQDDESKEAMKKIRRNLKKYANKMHRVQNRELPEIKIEKVRSNL